MKKFGDQIFRSALAIHIGYQIGQLITRGKELIQCIYFPGYCAGRKIIHAFEGQVHT